MTKEELSKHFDEVVSAAKYLLQEKQGNYAPTADCIGNFQALAEPLGLSPETVCVTLMMKHIGAIQKRIKQAGHLPASGYSRISDCINYLVFLQALSERHEKATMLNGWEPDYQQLHDSVNARVGSTSKAND